MRNTAARTTITRQIRATGIGFASSKTGWRGVFLVVLLSMLGAMTVAAAEYHVSPGGNSWAQGTVEEPWDLQTALSGELLEPGDTIWLHGGTYEGSFRSDLEGIEGNPIVVRAYPGELPRIDGVGSDQVTLALWGSWSVYLGFEVTNSKFSRWESRTEGLSVLGKNLTLANLIIHDVGNNSFSEAAEDLLVYGCLIFNNGYDDPARGHGHGYYAQNATGTKTFKDNVIFGGFGWGIHVYGHNGGVQGFDVIGNTWFNAGLASTITSETDNCLIGGYKPSERIRLLENNGWARQPTLRSVRLGWASQDNRDVTLKDNYLVGALSFYQPWSDITMTGNTVYGYIEGIKTKHYPDNDFEVKRPKGTRIALRPNQFEAGRALVTIYNWDEDEFVSVDPSAVMSVGDSYEIRDVENYLSGAVAQGTYTGAPISIPMDLFETAQVVGSPAATSVHTPREFGVYMLFNVSLEESQEDDAESTGKRSPEGRISAA